ncbi:hypothetical protein Dda_4641 [Drechslerella dactyloides]|uniref:Alpha-1,3-mannosyltransferase n=1 Tax=Drechslerella dactyloides TaxID=74499 RepID=A0AAD6IZI8_DREDA|nr:hypothetical protein Dda_4641 [Drechslerella dactyloides]
MSGIMKGRMNKPLGLFGSPPPPKEGRFHSPQYLERRKNTLLKVLAGALALALTYVVYVSTSDPKTASRHTERAKELLTKPAPAPDLDDVPGARLPQVVNIPAVGPEPAANIQTEPPTQPAEPVDENIVVQKPNPRRKQQKTYEAPSDDNDDAKPAGKATYNNKPEDEVAPVAKKSKPQSSGGAGSASFRKALTRIFDLLPDEIHVRELLRPIEGTGKEKLRETGLRTRAFKTFFEAWENLHLVRQDDDVFVRDDIVQELRADPSIDNIAQTIHQYEAYRGFLQRLANLLFPFITPYFSDHMSLHSQMHKGGRGIVLTGGDKQAPFMLTSIPSFRKLGCNLPIEVMYLGESDLSEDYRAELEQMDGVVTRDISAMVSDKGWRLAGWAAKPFAMLFSSFREVIFIDADSLFFKNPEVLFEDEQYKKFGALFFRDRIIMPENKKRWLQQVIPKPISKNVRQSRLWTGQSGHQQESGVVVVDKWRHFVAMLLVTRMNGPDRDGNESKGIVGVYDMVYGDKETFWLGWELVGDTDYAFHKGNAGIMGELKKQDPITTTTTSTADAEAATPTTDDEEVPTPAATKHTICAPQLLHLDLDGRPLWFNGWILSNKFDDKKHKANNFQRFISETPEPKDKNSDEPDQWKLKQNNICCLTSHESFEFSEEEKSALQMIMDIAFEVGAYGKK